jgi:hypothetical protein
LCAGAVGPEPGSRWSARSEARTNDLDAGEDRRIIEHHELPCLLGHGVLLDESCVGGCGRSGLAWVLESSVRLGDMTIDRVAQRVRDRVDL